MTERSSHRHALLITTSRHDDPQLGRLDGPATDAKVLAKVLRTASIGGFAVTTLTNQPAARAAEALEEFFADRDYDDVLLLFFSGHGLKHDDGELYLAMRNTQRRKLRSTSLPASFIRQVMRDSGSQRQMVILDCCYGGAFARDFAKGDDVDAVDHLSQGFGTMVLTASTALEFAWLEDKDIADRPPQSVFTAVIAEGLRTGRADVDGDGAITPQDLYNYARKQVRVRGAAQTPTLSSVGQEGEFLIAHAEPTSADLPRGLVQLATSPDPGDRINAVAALRGLFGALETPETIAARAQLDILSADESHLVATAAREALRELRSDKAALPVVDNTSSEYYRSPFYKIHEREVLEPPAPRVSPPRMKLQDVVGTAQTRGLLDDKRIRFHVVGDTGRAPRGDTLVAASQVAEAMVRDSERSAPAFCFLLGDIVMYFGEGKYYYEQFYEPFRNYHRPIFAIPGNHDGAVFGEGSEAPVSLEAFLRNFCAETARLSPDARGSTRRAMTQPGVYFTLDAPYVSIIGLYTNVLQGPGVLSASDGRYSLSDAQLAFLISELKRLRPVRRANKRAVIIACHHPPVDSPSLFDDIDKACERAGLFPDAVLSSHVRYYQRLSVVRGASEIPHIIAGTGSGRLRSVRGPSVVKVPGVRVATAPQYEPGFLSLSVDAGKQGLSMTIEFRTDDGTTADAVTVDLAASAA
jgi:caspase domain-containing protein/calcineurin-like phosphoesterase family protein